MLPRPLQTKGIKAIWEAQPMRNMRLLLNFNSGSNIHRIEVPGLIIRIGSCFVIGRKELY